MQFPFAVTTPNDTKRHQDTGTATSHRAGSDDRYGAVLEGGGVTHRHATRFNDEVVETTTAATIVLQRELTARSKQQYSQSNS